MTNIRRGGGRNIYVLYKGGDGTRSQKVLTDGRTDRQTPGLFSIDSMAKQPSPSFDFTELLHIDIQKSQDCQFNDQNGHAMFNLLIILLL